MFIRVFTLAGLTTLNNPSKVVSVCLGKTVPTPKTGLDGLAQFTTKFVLICVAQVLDFCLERQLLIESGYCFPKSKYK